MICDTNKHTHPMLFIPAVEQSISCKNIFEKNMQYILIYRFA
mgnify:CR=1 FL=1